MNATDSSVLRPESRSSSSVDQKLGFLARHPRIGKVASRIGEFAKGFFKFLVGSALFYLNPSMFFIGGIIGVIFDKQTEKTIKKMNLILEKQPWWSKALICGAGLLCLPVTLGFGSVLFGAAVGSHLSLSAAEGEKSEKTPVVESG